MSGFYDPRHPLNRISKKENQLVLDAMFQHFADIPKEQIRFCRVDLVEPLKEHVFDFERNPRPVPRMILVVIKDMRSGKAWELIVELNAERTNGRVVRQEQFVDRQPPTIYDDYNLSYQILVKHEGVRQACIKKGLNPDKIYPIHWTAYHYGPEKRISKPILYYKECELDNFYARPIEFLEVTIDLDKQQVIEFFEVEELKGKTPLPPVLDLKTRWWDEEIVKHWGERKDLKPIEIHQPEGVSFTVTDHSIVEWQNWRFRVGFNIPEGLTLHQISYFDKTRGHHRNILWRVSVSEMVVPYGDQRFPNNLKNAFDGGEDGLGRSVYPQKLGCDCLGSIYYFDIDRISDEGEHFLGERAVCLHEEDYGILFKHAEWAEGHSTVRRSRRLVISSYGQIGNYDYGFFWYFYQDGRIQLEIKLTGMLSVATINPGISTVGQGPKTGVDVYAPIHGHYFCPRFDFCLDGVNNSFHEINVEKLPDDPKVNPYRQAFRYVETELRTEQEGARKVSAESNRMWKVVNSNSRNKHGDVVGYRIMPKPVANAYAYEGSRLMTRAGFIKNHIWCTQFHPDEKKAGGEYTVQSLGDKDGLHVWAKKNRSIVNTDIVVWPVVGVLHIPTAEEWPLMPVEYAGVELKPDCFFDFNPAMDVPAEKSCHNKRIISKL